MGQIAFFDSFTFFKVPVVNIEIQQNGVHYFEPLTWRHFELEANSLSQRD